MSSKIHLKGLTPREAVTDALYRAIRSYDTYDIPLHDSAYYPSPTTTFILGAQATYTGIEEIRGILHQVGNLDTTHMVSAIRVEIGDDEKTAKLTATAMNQHCEPGKGADPEGKKFLGGARYDCDLKLDEGDGLWKFTRFGLELVWTQGDRSVMTSGGEPKKQ